MNPADLVAATKSIPAPWGLFQLLLLFFFALHLLLMNLLVGGGFWALVAELGKARSGNPENPAAVETRTLSQRLPFVIAFTINLGIPPLLFLQLLYGPFIYVGFQAAAVFALFALFLIALAYAALYGYKYRFSGPRRRLYILVAFLSLFAVTFFFTNLSTIMIDPPAWTGFHPRPQGFYINWTEPSLFPRWLHFLTAALAVSALFSALYRPQSERADAPAAGARVNIGMKRFFNATVIQIGIGIWFLFHLPPPVRAGLLGGDVLSTALLAAGVLLALAVLFTAHRKNVKTTTALLVLLVFAMVLLRDRVRLAYLSPYFQPPAVSIELQPAGLLYFLIALVVVSTLTLYAVRLAGK